MTGFALMTLRQISGLFVVALVATAAVAPARVEGACSAASLALLPSDSPLRRDISSLPVHSNSDAILAALSSPKAPGSVNLHPDFSGGEDKASGHIYYGIPINYVDTSKGDPFNPITFDLYGDQSDPGPYPFKLSASIEGSYPGCSYKTCDGDRHVLTVDQATCTLYEAWSCREPNGVDTKGWTCANGAKFDLTSSAMPQRRLGWTSGDAAGLPIAPLLVRVEEVRAGLIEHAIRFTASHSRTAYARPASHFAPYNEIPNAPWMGLQARLKASFRCAGLVTTAARTICTAMKKYGLILADNGSPWYFGGEASPLWETDTGVISNFDQFQTDIRSIKGSNFEVVDNGACLCTNDGCTTCPDTPPPSTSPNPSSPSPGTSPNPPSPSPSLSPSPKPGGSTEVFLRRGLAAAKVDGSSDPAYDQVVDAVISNAAASPAAPNGNTTFWPESQALTLQEAPSAGAYTSRALLRFGLIDLYVPKKKTTLLSAELTLTFINPAASPVAAQGLVNTQAWLGTRISGLDASRQLGWTVRQPAASNPGRRAPQKWSVPGVWPKSNRVASLFTFTIPAGVTTVTIPLPVAKIKPWQSIKNRSNFGVLIRLAAGEAGPVTVVGSLGADVASRPSLRITWVTK